MLVAAAVAVSPLATPAVVAAKPRARVAKQVVTGHVTVGTPNCVTQIHRRGNVATGALNGITGFDFDLDPKTRGGKFKLDVTAGAEVTNLDMVIIFYAKYGGPTDDVTGVVYDDTDEPGEYGIVPPGTTKALISLCQAGVSPTNEVSIGAGASFKYVGVGLSGCGQPGRTPVETRSWRWANGRSLEPSACYPAALGRALP